MRTRRTQKVTREDIPTASKVGAVRKKRKIDPAHESCARCGYMRKSHALANFADGPMIGPPVLICPFATWKSAMADGEVRS